MPLYIAKCGDLDRCYRCLTDSQSKDSATQLLTKYKSGALATQWLTIPWLNSLHYQRQTQIKSILLLLLEFLYTLILLPFLFSSFSVFTSDILYQYSHIHHNVCWKLIAIFFVITTRKFLWRWQSCVVAIPKQLLFF